MKFLILLQLNSFISAFPAWFGKTEEAATTSTTEALTTTTVPETDAPTTDPDWTTPKTTTSTEETSTVEPITSMDGGWTPPSFSTAENPTDVPTVKPTTLIIGGWWPPSFTTIENQTDLPENSERVCRFFIICYETASEEPKPEPTSLPRDDTDEQPVEEEQSFWSKLWSDPVGTLFGYSESE